MKKIWIFVLLIVIGALLAVPFESQGAEAATSATTVVYQVWGRDANGEYWIYVDGFGSEILTLEGLIRVTDFENINHSFWLPHRSYDAVLDRNWFAGKPTIRLCKTVYIYAASVGLVPAQFNENTPYPYGCVFCPLLKK